MPSMNDRRKKMDLSIIIPTYNVEDKIEECIKQINNQITEYTFEVILVDDGSTDNTVKTITKFLSKYVWLRVITQVNKKQAEARNTGLLNARGKYVCFIDSDDSINENYIQKMVDLIKDTDGQLGVCGIQKEWVNYSRDIQIENTSVFENADKKSRQKIIELFLNKNHEMDVGLWNKIFIRDLIEKNHVTFKNKNFFEDMLFVFEYLMVIDMNKISTCQEVLYTLIKRKQASTTTRYDVHMDELSDTFFEIVKAVVEKNFEVKDSLTNVLETLRVRLTIHKIHYHLLTDSTWNIDKTKKMVKMNIKLNQIFRYNLDKKYFVSCIMLILVPQLYSKLYIKRTE